MKVFITFGGGAQRFIDAGKRLIEQAESTNYFDKLIFYTPKELQEFPDFWNQHSDFISKNKRGYGYWIWKPYIIKKTMESMNDGDILLYLDAGCEIGGSKMERIPEFFNYVKEDKLIGTTYPCREKDWCKMDLLEHFEMENSDLIETGQRQPGTVMYCVCEETRSIVDLWYHNCCNYHLIDDSPSLKKNVKTFREHRHDQAIFSLLTKKYNLFSKKNLNNCVHIARNRSGKSVYNFTTLNIKNAG